MVGKAEPVGQWLSQEQERGAMDCVWQKWPGGHVSMCKGSVQYEPAYNTKAYDFS